MTSSEHGQLGTALLRHKATNNDFTVFLTAELLQSTSRFVWRSMVKNSEKHSIHVGSLSCHQMYRHAGLTCSYLGLNPFLTFEKCTFKQTNKCSFFRLGFSTLETSKDGWHPLNAVGGAPYANTHEWQHTSLKENLFVVFWGLIALAFSCLARGEARDLSFIWYVCPHRKPPWWQ